MGPCPRRGRRRRDTYRTGGTPYRGLLLLLLLLYVHLHNGINNNNSSSRGTSAGINKCTQAAVSDAVGMRGRAPAESGARLYEAKPTAAKGKYLIKTETTDIPRATERRARVPRKAPRGKAAAVLTGNARRAGGRLCDAGNPGAARPWPSRRCQLIFKTSVNFENFENSSGIRREGPGKGCDFRWKKIRNMSLFFF